MVMAPDLPGGGTAVSILHSTVVPGARQVVSTSTSPTTSHRHQRHSAENDGVFAELILMYQGVISMLCCRNIEFYFSCSITLLKIKSRFSAD